MRIPYRTRQILLRIGIIALVLLLVSALAFFCWFTWLERFVVYTRDNGAVLDLQLPPQVALGEEAVPIQREDTVSIYYNEGENVINTSRDLQQMVGYYADAEALQAGVDTVLAQAKALPTGTPVMLDVKNAKGAVFYSSKVCDNHSTSVDVAAMDQMIKTLDKRGIYLIARLPAFRDYYFGLNQTSNGLFVSSGAYLWADGDYCYWLDPTKDGTISYLTALVTELKNLGFDEVLFDEFRFPDTDNLRFSGDRAQTIANTASLLVRSCSTDNFAVSFVGQETFSLPEGRTRLYLKDAQAAQAAAIAQQTGIADPSIHLVFLTENHDTRFNDYSVLRPLEAAH